ncbi:MAG TPA: hypothetical protein HPP83_06625 [Candidatus Hydrogenedentes bacterium]|nr:hypothetical protein [Candidatus Hydrogenedentota bacterium]
MSTHPFIYSLLLLAVAAVVCSCDSRSPTETPLPESTAAEKGMATQGPAAREQGPDVTGAGASLKVAEPPAEGAEAGPRVASYTLTAKGGRECTIAFNFDRGNKLRNVDINPPVPLGGDTQLAEEFQFVSKNGKPVTIAVRWTSGEARELMNIDVLPWTPEPGTVPEGETRERTLLLETKEGRDIEVKSTWRGLPGGGIELRYIEFKESPDIAEKG